LLVWDLIANLQITYTSDYFQELYDLAVELIRRGHAYVDHQVVILSLHLCFFLLDVVYIGFRCFHGSSLSFTLLKETFPEFIMIMGDN